MTLEVLEIHSDTAKITREEPEVFGKEKTLGNSPCTGGLGGGASKELEELAGLQETSERWEDLLQDLVY